MSENRSIGQVEDGPSVMGRQGGTGAQTNKWTSVAVAKNRIKRMKEMQSKGVCFGLVEYFFGELQSQTWAKRGHGKDKR